MTSRNPTSRWFPIGVLLGSLLFLVAPANGAAPDFSSPLNNSSASCAAGDGLQYICGPVASEDLVRVPDTRWLLASGMNVGAPAHLYLIDSRSKKAAVAYPGVPAGKAPQRRDDSTCSAPDPQRMSLDGLALRPGADSVHTLYAANHGDRMAIEIFEVDARAARPRLQWVDCVVLPEHTLPNAVATLPDGSFLVISFYNPEDPQAWSRMAKGQVTGRILRWQPGRGFTEIPDSATSGGNGIATSADGTLVFASAWSARKLVVLSLRDGSRHEIALNFMPDNIHRLTDGSLLVGGQRTTVDAVHSCGRTCRQPWTIVHIEPATGVVQELMTGAGTDAINYACGAVALDGTVFITARGDQRIAYRHFPNVAYLR